MRRRRRRQALPAARSAGCPAQPYAAVWATLTTAHAGHRRNWTGNPRGHLATGLGVRDGNPHLQVLQCRPCLSRHGMAWNGMEWPIPMGGAGWRPRRRPASPTPVADPGNLRAPTDVALTVDGRQLVVADPGPPSIKLFTVDPNSNGILEPGEPAFVLTFASGGYGPGQLITPVGGGTGQGRPGFLRGVSLGSGARGPPPQLWACSAVAWRGRRCCGVGTGSFHAWAPGELCGGSRSDVRGISSSLRLAKRAASCPRLQMGVAAGADGIYVTDFPTGRVAKFNLTGGFVWQAGQTGPSDEEVSGRAPTPASAPGMRGGVASAPPPGYTPRRAHAPLPRRRRRRLCYFARSLTGPRAAR